MKVVVPFVLDLPEVRAATPGAERIYVGSDDQAYWRLLSGLWAMRESFIVVEHDIVPGPGMLAELAACPADWCAAQYTFEGCAYHGLGCTKFSAPLLRRVPYALERVGQIDSAPVHPAKHWCPIDAYLQFILRGAGEVTHQHGAVTHLRPGRSHGCPAPQYVRG